ncbi:hypothetical protein [Alkalihalobacillus sp. R86527]|uniref:hypothetical protein n=1 Tax=Alkalihalobacillus sp. R86527 TaxID=3093863 RepID=UPI00366B25E5
MTKDMNQTLLLMFWNIIGLSIGYFIFVPIVEDMVIGLVIGLSIGLTTGVLFLQANKSKSKSK